MKKLIVKREDASKLLYVLAEDEEPFARGLYDPSVPMPGDLYAAKIREMLPAAKSCFCDIGETRTAFFPGNNYKQGGMVLMQVKNAPREQEGKGAMLSDRITFNGVYTVVSFEPAAGFGNTENFEINVSKKIKDFDTQSRLRRNAAAAVTAALERYRPSLPYRTVIIVRTAAEQLPEEDTVLTDEIREVFARFYHVLSLFSEACVNSRAGKLCSDGFLSYIDRIYRAGAFEEILTDDPAFAVQLKEEAQICASKRSYSLRVLPKSQNGYDLFTLVNACRKLPGLLGRTVHLKSGAEIIVEKTEAMTVIDVNAAASRLSYPQINFEAGTEIMRQLRLRNIGGMIMCDFINTNEAEDVRLTEFLQELAKEDYAACTVYGVTRLGVMEISRKRMC